MVVFRLSGCIRAEVVVFGQKCLYSVKVAVFQQKWFCLDKSSCIRTKLLCSGRTELVGESGCIRAKGGCIRAKVVVFGQKRLYSGKVVLFVK